MHVGEVCVCVCVSGRNTNERKWLQCHPEDNDACEVITDLTNTG